MRPTAQGEKIKDLPKEHFLIVDKKGLIGNLLLEQLPKDISAIYVSEKKPTSIEKLPIFLRFINYRKRFPEVPRIAFSQIVVIYNGEKEVEEVFQELIKAAEYIKAKIIFAIPLSLYDDAIVKKLTSFYGRCYILVFGELFSSALFFNPFVPYIYKETITFNFFNSIHKEGRIIIPGTGLEEIYPVFLDDVVLGIKEISLNNHTSSRIFCFFPKTPLTLISFARIIQKFNPLISIDFSSNVKISSQKGFQTSIKDCEFMFENELLEKRIKETLAFVFNKQAKEKSIKINIISKKIKNYDFKLKQYLLSLFFTLITFPLITILLLIVGGYQLKTAKQEIESGEFIKAEKTADFAKVIFKISEASSKILFFQTSLIGKEDFGQSIVRLSQKGEEAADLISFLSNSSNKISKSLTTKGENNESDFQEATVSLKKAFTILQRLKVEQSGDLVDKETVKLVNKISFKNLESFALSSFDILPEILGFSKERKYAVLFQNNMELRPGGGFIGSYGILTIKEGMVKDFIIHDVYDADGQLKGHVEPPFPIRRYLPSVHWYLRDSNFNIDFTKNASAAAFFLNNEVGLKVDGVIGVDVSFVKELLKTTGPVYVPDYNETVTSDNLYLLTQSHSEKQFFPGSTQKKDFLRSLFVSLQFAVFDKKEGSKIPYIKLLEAINNSIPEKHLIFAFSNSFIQNLFTVNKMSSSLWDDRELNKLVLNDFTGISEANLGINKANYFVKRKVDQNIKISNDGTVLGKLSITYKNLSTKTSWPGGDYKNYLRVILPTNTNLTSVNIDGKKQNLATAVTDPIVYEKKGFIPQNALEVETTEENGKTIFGFLIIVPTEAFKTVDIEYKLPQKVLVDRSSFSYNTWLFKQPGVEEYPYSFSLSYPEPFKVLSLSNGLKDDGGKVVFQTKFLKDNYLTIDFSKP